MKSQLLRMKQIRGTDNLSTPKEAVDVLCKFVSPKRVWECAIGEGLLANHLSKKGFKIVLGSTDFFNEIVQDDFYDCIITNPPFSLKDKFLEECYKRKKPFALLLPITALEGKRRQGFYKQNGLQIIFLPQRIDFTGKKAPWFAVAWFTWGFKLKKDLNFV